MFRKICYNTHLRNSVVSKEAIEMEIHIQREENV